MKKISQTIRQANNVPLLYEVIPPQADSSDEKIKRIVHTLLDGLSGANVDAINIPEILDAQTPKMEPRKYGKIIRDMSQGKVDIIINRVVVHHPLSKQLCWLEETKNDFGIDSLVLVGGAHQRIQYQGPSVSEMAQAAKGCVLGGILIPHRQEKDSGQSESDRAISKQQAGLEFFTSQVLYESQNTKTFLKEYDTQCKEKKLTPKRVFLSFAPVSSKKDLNFLKKLGVIVPDSVIEQICQNLNDITEQSLKFVESLFDDIQSFVEANHLNVPLGINVEYVTRHNRTASYEMIRRLNKLYNRDSPLLHQSLN